jgi:hypothetical protein
VAIAADGMAIKPALSTVKRLLSLLGATEVIDFNTVKGLMDKERDEILSFIKGLNFNTEALEVHFTALDNSVTAPGGIFFLPPAVTTNYFSELMRQAEQAIGKCFRCLYLAFQAGNFDVASIQ